MKETLTSRLLSRDMLAVVCLGLATRAYWLYRAIVEAGGQYDNPPSDSYSMDPFEYLRLARSIRQLHSFSIAAPGEPPRPTAFRPPGYPALISLLWWGEPPPLTQLFIVQALCGVATSALVYLISRRRFSRAVSLVAGIGFALAPMSGHFTGQVLSETFFTFLLTLAVYLWGEERFVWSGIGFGLALLTRTTLLPFLLGLPLLTLLPGWKKQRRAYLTIVVAAFLTVSPWVLRNAFTLHRFIPVASAGGGVNMLYGTFNIEPGRGNIWRQIDAYEEVLRTDAPYYSEEREGILMSRAVARIKADPKGWIIVRLKQYPRLFMDHGEYMYPSSRILSVALKVLFLLGNLALIILAAMGIYLERRRITSLGHIVLFPVYLALVHLPMWTEARYSLPMMPMTAILASVSLVSIYSSWRLKSYGRGRGRWAHQST